MLLFWRINMLNAHILDDFFIQLTLLFLIAIAVAFIFDAIVDPFKLNVEDDFNLTEE
jgi:hypothetical protein